MGGRGLKPTFFSKTPKKVWKLSDVKSVQDPGSVAPSS